MRIGSGPTDTIYGADRYTTTLILTDVTTKTNDRTLKKVLTLLDTGASLSCGSEDLADDLKNAGCQISKETTRCNDPIAAKGARMGIAYDIILTVTVPGKPLLCFSNLRISIIPGLRRPLILGSEALRNRSLQL